MWHVTGIIPEPLRAAAGSTRARLLDRAQGSKLGQAFGRSRFWQRVLILAGGTALGQVIMILGSPILTRLYDPAAFGILAVFVSILSIPIGIAGGRYQMAIPIAEEEHTVTSLLILCISILLIMTTVLGIAAIAFGSSLERWTNAPGLQKYLPLLPISFLGAGLYQVLSTWALRYDAFSTLGLSKIRQSIGMMFTQLLFGILGAGAGGLLIGDAIGRGSGSATLAKQAWSQVQQTIPHPKRQDVLDVAVRYKRFPLIGGTGGLFSGIGMQFPTLIISAHYGASVVGMFALSQRLVAMSFVLVASAIGNVFFSEFAQTKLQRPEQMMPQFWKTVRRSLAISLAMAVLVALLAPLTFGHIFGDRWTDAGHYAQLLMIGAVPAFITRTVGSSVTVLERQDLDVAGEFIAILLGCGSLLLGGVLDLKPLSTIALYSLSTCVGGLVTIALSWYAIHRAGEYIHGEPDQ